MGDVVVGVLGASGGLGVSTLAVALALRAGDRHGLAAGVDGDLTRGGLDVTACVEHQAGVRWGDLTAVEGEVDGPGLLRSLPAERNARFLAAGSGAPSASVVGRVVAALAETTSLVVVDCGTRGESVGPCTDVLLVCGTSVRQLADGAACAAHVHARGVRAGLVLRTVGRSPVEPEDVAFHLDLPLVATMRDDARVAGDPVRGRAPGLRGSDAVGAVADRVLDGLMTAGAAERRGGGRGQLDRRATEDIA
jgi:MinD-like ATPase involved in chromosome partitioning or flagellar assembly